MADHYLPEPTSTRVNPAFQALTRIAEGKPPAPRKPAVTESATARPMTLRDLKRQQEEDGGPPSPNPPTPTTPPAEPDEATESEVTVVGDCVDEGLSLFLRMQRGRK